MIFANLKRTQIPLMRASIDTADRELKRIEAQNERGCKSCRLFAASTNWCSHHKDCVPVDFHPAGCDEWQYDDIPF